MASIGTTLPVSSAASANASAAGAGAATQNSANSLGNTNTFLSLLVAQLQNQDPTNPVDGTAFVTQLAEFNNVEQSLAIRQDMDAVTEKYLGTTVPPSVADSTTTPAASTTKSL